jgi:hypothetical protein
MKHFVLLISLFLSARAQAQWSTDLKENTPIGDITFAQDGPSIVSDGSGGTIISWSDSHNDGATYAQRYNAAGFPQWQTGGVPVSIDAFMFPNMVAHSVVSVSDGAGGAFIAWQGRDFKIPLLLTGDVYAQHISASGQALWQVGGVPVDTAINGQYSIQIIGDGAGGAIFSWSDGRAVPTKVYAQRIGSGGNSLWKQNGQQISMGPGEQGGAKMVSDGSGGAIFVWQDIQGGLSGNRSIVAQRINGSGEILWAQNGISICTFYAESPSIAKDGNGGAYIIWQDVYRSGRSVYAQRINSQGEVQWAVNGIPVGIYTQSRQIPVMTDDNAGGAILAFHCGDLKGQHVYVQRINSAGTSLWTANADPSFKGVNICPDPVNPGGYAGLIQQEAYSIEKDGAGGAVIAFVNMNESTGPYKDIYTQRINADGELQWTAHGVAVCTAPNHQTGPVLACDASGNTVLAWDDLRKDQIYYNVYIQQVSNTGLLGTITTGLDKVQPGANSQVIQNYPNPFSQKTVIQFAISNKQPVQLKVYDIVGNEVTTLVNEDKPAGKYTVNFDATNIPDGIYIVKLQSGKTITMRKMIVKR